MRQLVLIAGIVGVLMYAAVVSQQGVPALAAGFGAGVTAPARGLGPLQKALEATGAHPDEAIVTGWVLVKQAADRDRVVAALGWNGRAPQGEVREAGTKAHDSRTYVTVRWVLQGKAVPAWQSRVALVQRALDAAGTTSAVTVQLGGTTSDLGLTELTGRGLDALAATDRQPWSDMRAASVAGRTSLLPPGPYGPNVQMAVRKDVASGKTHVWVAWPALLQEY